MKWQIAHEDLRSDMASLGLSGLLLVTALSPRACGAGLPAAAHFRKKMQPILEKYCSDCHADGMNKGGVAFDEFKSDEALLGKHDLWLAVLKNTRAGLMPPAKKRQPSAEERQRLEEWIKFESFGIDARNPDPGRCRVAMKVDDRELLQKEFGWYDNKTFRFDFDE